MREIELKILEIDPEEIKRKLNKLGAEKIQDVDIHALHFDYPDGHIKKNDQLLRVRQIGGKVELCFKGSSQSEQFRNAEEIEVITTDFEKTITILERVGLNKIFEMKRRRESYRIGKTRFEIDYYPNLPPFVEIEAPSEEEIEGFVRKLGFTMEQTTNMTGTQVIKYYQEKNVKNPTT